uniref:Hypermethylated in cancer 2 protein n=1 Tax=Mola mola TaxID=94237 RepID=A0A3Q3WWN1_MOLML
MELPNHAKQLLLQLNQQRAKGFLCDVIIVVENALFRAHKNILAASSIYFKSLVLHDNLINLDTEMVNPSVFRQVLDFIYTGKLLSSSDQSSEQNFSALLTAASYLQLHDLAALPHSNSQESPQSASVSTTNSASLDDSSTTLPGVDTCGSENMELNSSCKASEETQNQPEGPPPQKKSRQGARKNEWPKKETSGLKSEDHDRPLVNGVIVGPKEGRSSGVGGGSSSSFTSDQCKDEEDGGENGQDHSDEKEGGTFVKEEDEEEAEDLSAPMGPSSISHWLTRPFPCNICGKMFTQRGTMTRHMRSHLGLKPFACEECGMRFTRQYRLTEHMRVHSGEKPYECQLCGGKFTQQRNLISHLRMHTSPS